MPLVADQRELLLPALEQKRAVGAFNVSHAEMAQADIRAAEEVSEEIGRTCGIIIQNSQGTIRHLGWDLATDIVRSLARSTRIPISLNLDHGTSLDQCKKAFELQYSAVLFDGSSRPLDENIHLTKKVVEIAQNYGIPVEAELGRIPKIEDYFSTEEIAHLRTLAPKEVVRIIREKAESSVEELMAKPDDVERFVEETGCDFLAAAFGSIHGIWDDIWPVRIDRLKEIQERRKIPLVSHGSSGILMTPKDAEDKEIDLHNGEGTLLDAIQTGGVSKVNVATVLSVAYIQGFNDQYRENPSEKDSRNLVSAARDRVKEKVKQYLLLFEGAI